MSRTMSAVVVLVVVLQGCAAVVEGADARDGDGEQEVAVASEALGSTVTIGVVSLDARVRDWTSTLLYFELDSDEFNPETLGIFQLSDGSLTTWGVPGEIGAVEADSNTFFSNSTNDDILQWGVFGHTKRADSNGDVKGKMALDSTYVYWADTTGIRRVARGGGAVTTLLTDAGVTLYGRDGSWLYYLRKVGSTTYYLKKIRTDGTGNATLHSIIASTPRFEDLSWDLTHFYWVDNQPSDRRIMRMPKIGGAPGPFITSTVGYFTLPVSNGSYLYYARKTSLTPSAATTSIEGFDLQAWESVTSKTGLKNVTSLHFIGSDLYWTEEVYTGSMGHYVRKASFP